MRKSTLLSSTASLALCLGEILSTSAAQYSITEIPQMAHALGVNRYGAVVGEGSSSGTFFLYVHSSGVLNALPTGFVASDINDQGRIIGDHSVAGAPPSAAILYVSGGEKLLTTSTSFFLTLGHAISHSGLFAAGQGLQLAPMGFFSFLPFRWGLQDDSIAVLPLLAFSDFGAFPPIEIDGDAKGVNDNGVVVGNSGIRLFDALGHEIGTASHAVRWQDGMAMDLGTLPGGKNSDADGINDRGEIVGGSDTGNGNSHAFLLRRHRMLDLGTLGHDSKLNSNANRINDQGEIVGWSEIRLASDNSVVRRAFVSSEGRMRNLTELIEKKGPLYGRVTLTSANAISSNGWIAADGFDDTTLEPHAYLLVPHDDERARGKRHTIEDSDGDEH